MDIVLIRINLQTFHLLCIIALPRFHGSLPIFHRRNCRFICQVGGCFICWQLIWNRNSDLLRKKMETGSILHNRTVGYRCSILSSNTHKSHTLGTCSHYQKKKEQEVEDSGSNLNRQPNLRFSRLLLVQGISYCVPISPTVLASVSFPLPSHNLMYSGSVCSLEGIPPLYYLYTTLKLEPWWKYRNHGAILLIVMNR